jgi:hypothetical protein
MRLAMAARPFGGTDGSPERSEDRLYLQYIIFHFGFDSVNLNVYLISP